MSVITQRTTDSAIPQVSDETAASRARRWEALAAGAATLCAVLSVVLFRLYGGGLWRDEVNSINFSTLPTVGDMWRHLDSESFPMLWMLLERGWASVLGASDAVLRTVGLVTALALIASVWLCARWCGYTPAVAMALIAVNPTLLRTASLNRAYGLGILLMVVAYHAIWRMAQAPTRKRTLGAAVVALLATQTLYYNIIFVAVMLTAAGGIQWHRGNRRALWPFAAILGLCGVSLVPYVFGPIRQERAWSFLISHRMNAHEIMDTTRLAMNLPSLHHLSIFGVMALIGLVPVWLGLIALCAWSLKVYTRPRAAADWQDGGDTARYASVTVLASGILYLGFIRKVGYYVEPFHLCAIMALASIGASHLLSALRPSLVPGRTVAALTVALLCLAFPRAGKTSVMRQSNADVVADVVNARAQPGDLVLVAPYWLGQPFARYYHGQAPWITSPTLGQYSYGGEIYILDAMVHPTPNMDHLREITQTLKSGHALWLVRGVGEFPASPATLLPPMPPYPADTRSDFGMFLGRLMQRQSYLLLHHVGRFEAVGLPDGRPVNPKEDMEIVRCSGWMNKSLGHS